MAATPGRRPGAHRGAAPLTPLPRVPPVLLVAAGGALGGLARAAAGDALARAPGEWPWSTVLVNTVGAALLCALLVTVQDRGVRLLLGTGLLGAFTTFSGFTLDAVLLVDEGRPGLAAAYVLVSLVALLLGGAAGIAAGRAVRR